MENELSIVDKFEALVLDDPFYNKDNISREEFSYIWLLMYHILCTYNIKSELDSDLKVLLQLDHIVTLDYANLIIGMNILYDNHLKNKINGI